jgi:hypothetical protein
MVVTIGKQKVSYMVTFFASGRLSRRCGKAIDRCQSEAWS